MNNYSVLIARTNHPNSDSRLRRIIAFHTNANFRVQGIYWSKEDSDKCGYEGSSENYLFKGRGNFGGGYKNIVSLIRFNRFIALQAFQSDATVFYSCDLDTFFPLWLISRFRRRYIVFDEFDYYHDRIAFKPLKYLFIKLRQFAIQNSDIAIFPSEGRRKDSSGVIIENIPENPLSSKIHEPTLRSDPHVLFYGGSLLGDRGILETVELVGKNPKWKMIIAGKGPLKPLIENLEAKYQNIKFLGPLSHLEILELTQASDMILAMYDPSVRNNVDTASNKLFEGAQLKIPILTNNKTCIGDEVMKYNLGWSVDFYNKSQVLEILNSFDNLRSKLRPRTSIFFENHSTSAQQSTLLSAYEDLTGKMGSK